MVITRRERNREIEGEGRSEGGIEEIDRLIEGKKKYCSVFLYSSTTIVTSIFSEMSFF